MKKKVEIKIEREIEEYWLLRGIYDNGLQKRVVTEKEFDRHPTTCEIAEFLEESKATFVSIERNYRFPDPESELPFE